MLSLVLKNILFNPVVGEVECRYFWRLEERFWPLCLGQNQWVLGTEPLLSSARAVCTPSSEPALQSLAAFEMTGTLKSDIWSPYIAQADIKFSILLSARMAGMCLCPASPVFQNAFGKTFFLFFFFLIFKDGVNVNLWLFWNSICVPA